MATNPADRTTPLDSDGQGDCNKEQTRPTIQMHPYYKCKRDDYIQIDDCLRGERQVKDKGVLYLPKTSAQESDDPHGKAYDAYKRRAIYYNFPKDTADAALGMLQREPAKIELPTAIESLEELSTNDSETVHEVLADINQGQIEYGRFGLLVDVPDTEAPEAPYLVKYHAISIVNWDEEFRDGIKRLRMVTLNESSWEITGGGQQEWVEKYRYCALDENGEYWTAVIGPGDVYEIDTKNFNPPKMGKDIDPYPNYKGKRLDYVPFVFVNVSDLRPRPQTSPILDICSDSIHLYMQEADRQQALFMQGQATPWMKGILKDEKPGNLGATTLLTAKNPDADFGFLELKGNGLSSMAENIDALKQQVIGKGVALVDTSTAESGKALAIRSSSKTSILKTIALTGARGLRQALSYAYDWTQKGSGFVEADKDELSIAPNLDFVDDDNSTVAKDLLTLMQAKAMGAKLSDETIHQWMQKKELTTKEFETELEDLNNEAATMGGAGDMGGDA